MPPIPVTSQNGYAIRAFREREGLTLAMLAQSIGVSESHLRNIETENRSASPHHLGKIADILNVPTAALARIPASRLRDNRAGTRREARALGVA